MWNLFGTTSYSGSNLERLLQGRIIEIRSLPPDTKELCAQALLRERPDFFAPTEVGGQTPPPLDRQTLEVAALGIANAMSMLIGSAATFADFYGKQIDQLNQSNSVAALVLANCLVAYCEACNVPFAATEGGYRRYFTGYLLLRQSLRMFGLLDPWERVMATVKNDSGDSLSGLFNDKSTETLMKALPISEQSTLAQVLQGLGQYKTLVDLIPSPAASWTLGIALQMPEQLMTGQWSPITNERSPPPGTGRCTFCGGSGKRSSCGGCNGTGRKSRLGSGGQVEITVCTVCYGSGRARCDMCLGTGRR
jgi:hypothetical protein